MRERTKWKWFSSVAAGAAVTYFFDRTPNSRHRRIGDAVHRTNTTPAQESKSGQDVSSKTRGIVAMARRFIRRDEPGGVVLEERQTSVTTIQSATSPPPALDNHQHSFAATTRAIVGSSGAALVAVSAARRDRIGLGLAGAGAALVARALTNVEFGPVVGFGTSRRAIDVHKTITVDLPIDQVFAFCDDIANLPAVMHHVREVRATRDPGLWHWTASGGANGGPIEFDTVVTERVPNRVLAWKTTADSLAGHSGLIRFDPLDADRTRLQIRLWYNPPGGAPAPGARTLIEADPENRPDENLIRMKTGREPATRN